jgi:hypothetical protein
LPFTDRAGSPLFPPPTTPAFATAVPAAILAPMPPLEINATQPRLNSQFGIVTEIIGKSGNADQLRRTRDLLLPRLLSGQVSLKMN